MVMLKYISVVVPEEIDRELRFACADQAVTKSRFVRKLIEDYLAANNYKNRTDLIKEEPPEEEE